MNLPIAISIAAAVPFFAGLASLIFASCQAGKKPLRSNAVLFHAVSDDLRSGLSNVRPDVFSEFVSLVEKKRIEAATVSDFVNQPSSNKIAITFDDGYSDIYETCFPILSHARFVATVYMISSRVGGKSGWDIYSGKKMLSSSQLKELSDAGWQIGSHSHSHPDLTLLDKSRLAEELVLSKKIIEDITGKEVDSISFPFGRWNMRVWGAAQNAGYKTACSYGKASASGLNVIKTNGTYLFDSAQDILDRTGTKNSGDLNALSRGLVMPHFAKGSPLWNFRNEYRFF